MQQQGPSWKVMASQCLEDARVCILEMSELLEACRAQFRRKSHQMLHLPQQISEITKHHDKAASIMQEADAVPTTFRKDPAAGSLTPEPPRGLEVHTIALQQEIQRWSIIKRCSWLTSLRQQFPALTKEAIKQKVALSGTKGKERHALYNEITTNNRLQVSVVEGGYQWVVVQTIKPNRLARQLADSGWSWGDYKSGDVVPESEWEDVAVTKQLRRLVSAARLNRFEYRIPSIRYVVPNISWTGDPELAVYFHQLTSIHPDVEVILNLADGEFLTSSAPSDFVARLLEDPLANLTDTLVLDHTVLVDLASDLTHLKLEPQPWQAETTRVQIEEELQHGGYMVKWIYPLLANRQLVITHDAAEQFYKLLATVGTDEEQRRSRLLVPDPSKEQTMSDLEIRCALEELSVHKLPDDVQFPIRILDEDWTAKSIQQAVDDGTLPKVALDVARLSRFKASKLSTFLSGWASGSAIMTSNKEIAGQFKTWVEENRQDANELGPRIYSLGLTRNMLSADAKPRPGRTME